VKDKQKQVLKYYAAASGCLLIDCVYYFAYFIFAILAEFYEREKSSSKSA